MCTPSNASPFKIEPGQPESMSSFPQPRKRDQPSSFFSQSSAVLQGGWVNRTNVTRCAMDLWVFHFIQAILKEHSP